LLTAHQYGIKVLFRILMLPAFPLSPRERGTYFSEPDTSLTLTLSQREREPMRERALGCAYGCHDLKGREGRE
jgi:hypothetical protein